MKVTQDECWDRACGECGVIVNGEKLCRRCRELLTLRATVRDLKARLRSIRSAMGRADFPDHGVGYCQQPECALCREYATTDLRVKNWRKL